MNKIKTNIFAAFLTAFICSPCFAADEANATNSVIERMNCTDVQARINELSAITPVTDEITAELIQLQNKYRSDCVKSASGRRTIGRITTLNAAPTVDTTPVATEVVTLDATTILNSFVEKQKSNCQSLKTSMDRIKQNSSTSSDDLAKLENQYKEDCAKYDETVVAVEEVEVDPEKIAANIEAGLCADGSKPNRFGCCEGETFKDMGNLVFACCPDDGGDCYPPITAGTLL